MIIQPENYTYRISNNKFILTIFVTSDIEDEIIIINSGLIQGYFNKFKDNIIVYVQNMYDELDVYECKVYDINKNNKTLRLTFKIENV